MVFPYPKHFSLYVIWSRLVYKIVPMILKFRVSITGSYDLHFTLKEWQYFGCGIILNRIELI
jgi:hypothetical protein